MNLKEYREKYQLPFKDEIFIGYIISCRISFVLNKFFYSEKLIPNHISFWMFLSGFFGGVLYSIPQNFIKVIGYVLMHFWFIFDAWDGEVARQTKRFSKYGKEFDYLVHLVVHPIMLGGIYFNIGNEELKMLCIIYLILDLVLRGLYNLHFSYNHMDELDKTGEKKVDNKKIREIFNFIMKFLTSGPNIILIIPILLFFNMILISKIYFLFASLGTLLGIYFEIYKKIRIYLQ